MEQHIIIIRNKQVNKIKKRSPNIGLAKQCDSVAVRIEPLSHHAVRTHSVADDRPIPGKLVVDRSRQYLRRRSTPHWTKLCPQLPVASLLFAQFSLSLHKNSPTTMISRPPMVPARQLQVKKISQYYTYYADSNFNFTYATLWYCVICCVRLSEAKAVSKSLVVSSWYFAQSLNSTYPTLLCNKI